MIKNWNGLGEFVGVAKTTPNYVADCDDWTGYIDHATACKKALDGDNSYVEEAEKLLDKLDASIEMPQATWQASIYGAYPIVPEFLAGSITPMRHRVEATNDTTPIAIYVSTTCSAVIGSSDMLKRGTAILALVLKLQQVRPVELYLLAETHGRTDGEYLQVIRIESKPVDISVAAFVLCHVGFARHLTYGVAKALDGFNGSWPNNYQSGGKGWEMHVREVLEMSPNDLYIGAARAWDDMIKHPVEWVNAQVKQFLGMREDEGF